MTRSLARSALFAAASVIVAGLTIWSMVPGSRGSVAFAAIADRFARRDHERDARMQTVPARTGATGAAATSKGAKGVATPQRAATKPAPTAQEQLGQLRKPMSDEPGSDPFTVSSWLPPPPPPPPPPPVVIPPPTAPPLPFAYLGALGANPQKSQVFLSNGDRLLIVSPGDVIDGQYRIDSIASGVITITYLPLRIRQMLSTEGEGK